MSNVAHPIHQADALPKLPSIQAGAAVRAIVPNDFDSAWRIANAVVKSGMAPRGVDTPEKAMVAIMHGLEVGMTPMMALQSIAPINGRPAIYGDGALGLVQGSGLLEWHKEYYEGTPDTDGFTAVCEVKRKGDPEVKRGEFSIKDAKEATLYGKDGPWKQYRKRMLKMRARGFALRDGFSDVLRGLHIAEEAQDIPMRDITLRDDGPPPPPSKVIEHKPSDLELAESGRDNGGRVLWTETGETQVAAEAFDSAQWRKDAEGAISGCENAGSLFIVSQNVIQPERDKAFPPDWDAVQKAYKTKFDELSAA